MQEFSSKAIDFQNRLKSFMEAEIYPSERRFYDELRDAKQRWSPVPVIEELKVRAKAAGLWNLFLPESELGAGLSNY